jgi:uncharacterized protein (DUF1499 family)
MYEMMKRMIWNDIVLRFNRIEWYWMILNDIECFEGPPDVLNKSAVSINTQPCVFMCLCVCAASSQVQVIWVATQATGHAVNRAIAKLREIHSSFPRTKLQESSQEGHKERHNHHVDSFVQACGKSLWQVCLCVYVSVREQAASKTDVFLLQ